MAVERQMAWQGQWRVDVPHLRAIESAVAADFDVVVGQVMSGQQPLVVTGLTLSPTNPTGLPASLLTLSVAGAVLLNYNASEAGSFHSIPGTRTAEILGAGNSRVSGSFSAGTTNYVTLDLVRAPDATTSDLVKFLQANTLQESSQTVPLGRILDYSISISTNIPTGNLLPIAIVRTDASNNVVSVTDARNLAYRLGSGGSTPAWNASYDWSGSGRQELQTEATSGNAFSGGDKAIASDWQWRRAIMSRIWELGGGSSWYSQSLQQYIRVLRRPGTPGSPTWFLVSQDNYLAQLTYYQTVSSGAITAGAATPTVGTMNYNGGGSVSVGDVLGINVGLADQEYVSVISTNAGTAPSAVFALNHPANAIISRVDVLSQGLAVAFANSPFVGASVNGTGSGGASNPSVQWPVYYNTITNVTGISANTNLSAGQCLYVDIDSTAYNPVTSTLIGNGLGSPAAGELSAGESALTIQKGTLATLGSPTQPGARIVLAWAGPTGDIHVRDSAKPLTLYQGQSPIAVSASAPSTYGDGSAIVANTGVTASVPGAYKCTDFSGAILFTFSGLSVSAHASTWLCDIYTLHDFGNAQFKPVISLGSASPYANGGVDPATLLFFAQATGTNSWQIVAYNPTGSPITPATSSTVTLNYIINDR